MVPAVRQKVKRHTEGNSKTYRESRRGRGETEPFGSVGSMRDIRVPAEVSTERSTNTLVLTIFVTGGD